MQLDQGRYIRLATPVLLSALLIGPGDRLSAQQAQRDGLWFGGGIGMGIQRVHCPICRNDRNDGLAAHMRIGGTPSQHLLLGFEGHGWSKREESVSSRLGAVHAAAYWYPTARRGSWYLKGGLGVVAYRAEENGSDDEPITARSLSGEVGAGYDLRIAPQVSITPYFNFVSSFYADLYAGGDALTNVNLTLIQFGLGLTVH